VTHDTTESAPGKFAEHHLDVTGRYPSGKVERLILECRHWSDIVGKDTLDKLVGVRAQLGSDAAAVSRLLATRRARSMSPPMRTSGSGDYVCPIDTSRKSRSQ
jgi:hypothetical protein